MRSFRRFWKARVWGFFAAAAVAASAVVVTAGPASAVVPTSGSAAGAIGAPGTIDAEAARTLARGAEAVFEQKCAECHSPRARKVKKFGYVTDLSRLAANPKLVVPHDPSKSKLWVAIEEGDMPPDEATAGPLSDEQKQAIRRWIEAGAPAGGPSSPGLTSGGPAVPATAPPAAGLPGAGSPGEGSPAVLPDGGDAAAHDVHNPAARPAARRVARWVGRFHALVVHFPIALVFAAALAELAWLRTRAHWLTGAVRFCTALGAAAAVGAGTLGWINASFHTPSPLLTTHRWLGTAAILWTLPLVWLCERGVRRARVAGAVVAAGADPRAAALPDPADSAALPVLPYGSEAHWANWTGRSRLVFRVALFAGALLVGLTAHMGGSLVYGVDYFRF